MSQLDTIQQTANKIIENQTYVAPPKEVVGLMGESVLIALALFAVIVIVLLSVYQRPTQRRNGFWDFCEKHLTLLFAVVWFMGFSVYLVGSSIGSCGIGRLMLQAPMAFVYAFEMFIFSSDVSAIHSEFYSSLLFMTLFSLVHFCAAAISIMFVFKYFGYNLIAKLRLYYISHRCEKKQIDDLYVFWGMNEATYCLAKDINQAYKEGRATGRHCILIVNTADDDSEECGKEPTALERLFSFISFNKEELNRFKDLGCLTINVFKRLSKVKLDDDAEKTDIFADKLNAKRIKSLIGKTKGHLHFFFLGNDEYENIVCSTLLCHDITIESFSPKTDPDNQTKKDEDKNNVSSIQNSHDTTIEASSKETPPEQQEKPAKGIKVKIYCHARYDSVNRVVEDKYSTKDIDVRVVDSSHESINLLRSRQAYHPINFVDIDTEKNFGTVTSAFNSMVIGFGETGRDAVRFLYEFAAFVGNDVAKEDSAANAVNRSPFHCYIVDRDAERLEGQFRANAPAITNVTTWQTDILSPQFYEHLKSVCKDLNYIVIALGDDELNISTAVRVFTFIRKNRAQLKNFKIFVRCHNYEQKRRLQHIADHYNQQESVNEEYLVVFGTEDQLYTYDKIIENDFVDEGRLYNLLYCEASKKKGKKDIWDSRREVLLNKKTLDALSELRRKESQDIANSYHALTKRLIMESVSKERSGELKPAFKHILDCLENRQTPPVFVRNEETISAIDGNAQVIFTPEEQLLFLNLARLEHLRWNAAHEVLGYQSYAMGDPDCELVKDEGDQRHGCNERFKLHNTLINCNELDAEMNDEKNIWHPDYKLFDYMVVTATLMQNDKALVQQFKKQLEKNLCQSTQTSPTATTES